MEYVSIPGHSKKKWRLAWRKKLMKAVGREYDAKVELRLCKTHFPPTAVKPAGKKRKSLTLIPPKPGHTLENDGMPYPPGGRPTGGGHSPTKRKAPYARSLERLTALLKRCAGSSSPVQLSPRDAQEILRRLEEGNQREKALARTAKVINGLRKEKNEAVRGWARCTQKASTRWLSWESTQEWTDVEFHELTGVPSKAMFHTMHQHALRIVPSLIDSTSGRPREVCAIDRHLLTLYMIRTGSTRVVPARAFGVSKSSIGYFFREWVEGLAVMVHTLYPPPSATCIRRKNYPASWKNAFGGDRITMVIDSTNIDIETPIDPGLNTGTYSSYYGGNVVKVLIGQTPQGAISYVSRAFPGHLTDADLLESSLFRSEQLESGTCLLADRGFMNFSILSTKGVGMFVPPKGKRNQGFSVQNVLDTRKIANKRIHVERVMSRIKAYSWLKKTVRASQVDLISDVVSIVCNLCNLQNALTDMDVLSTIDVSDLLGGEEEDDGESTPQSYASDESASDGSAG